ncbi:MAG: phosphoglucosamine mutase [Proteobacteria bacterium]|nr:phosphoglucosamine mutase [Pseudomonadota bacterium]MCL2308221.1 phosphoglucosamine mutase [Pseudomonadota bacterium]
MTKRRYFGTDGIRGRVGTTPITPEFALKLGWAAGRVLARAVDSRRDDHAGVLIGKDTRSSGYLLEAALEAGLSAAGVDVYLTGPLPTPAVAYLTRALRRSAGIVISASHNAYSDNGIKFFSAAGTKLPDAIETAIEEEIEQPLHCVDADALGKAWRVNDAAGRYIEFCKSTFPNELDLKGWRIVVDCAHGAGYHVAPPVLHELGAEVIAVAAEPNGLNINDGVGAVHTAFLSEQVRAHQADLGLALDGDGDRLMMADAKGRIYDGDVLLYIIARDYQRRGVAIPGVVGTLMSNFGFEQALSRHGLALERAAVGDRYVMEQLLQKGWLLGGENSGHLICLDKHSTGDGIIAALAVLRALIEQQVSLEDAACEVALYPQCLINVPLKAGWRWKDSARLRAEETAMAKTLGQRGRLLLRPSGTEPLLRVMVEAEDETLARTSAAHLADVVRAAMQEETAS